MTGEELIAPIKGPSPRYKRQAVDDIVASREAATPALLALLDDVLHDPEPYCDPKVDAFDSLYALVLLAHFREPQAHSRILALASLPEEQLDFLLGGFITEGLDLILLATCGGQTDGIRALLQNREANLYVRAQAATALARATTMGLAERDEVLAFLSDQLTQSAEDPSFYYPSGIADAMLHLHPIEHREQLLDACDTGLIEPIIFGRKHVEERLAEGAEGAAARLAAEPGQPEDVHDWLSGWACFDEPRYTPTQPLPAPAPPTIAPPTLTPARPSVHPEKKRARKRQRDARKKQRKKR